MILNFNTVLKRLNFLCVLNLNNNFKHSNNAQQTRIVIFLIGNQSLHAKRQAIQKL